MISARRFYREGRFGDLFYTESEYHHPGLEEMYHNPDGSRTWRYGLAPMNYPTRCTSCLVSVTGTTGRQRNGRNDVARTMSQETVDSASIDVIQHTAA